MSWGSTTLVGILSGIAGLLCAGFLASQCVDWYRISSFEGQAGYFVVMLALLGGVAGAIIGVLLSRAEAAAGYGFALNLARALGAVLVVTIGVAIPARLLADVPPEIDGEPLHLVFELQWPDGIPDDPRTRSGAAGASLGATSNRVVRRMEDGVLFLDGARRENNTWTATGVVPVFTERGERFLDVQIGDSTIAGFLVPLPRRPGRREQEWSAWLPHQRTDGTPAATVFRYRFKVVKRSEAIRNQHVGTFEVETRAAYFYRRQDSPEIAAQSTFGLRRNGAPVSGLGTVSWVAAVGGARPALLVSHAGEDGESSCVLLMDDATGLRRVDAGTCASRPGLQRIPRSTATDGAEAAVPQRPEDVTKPAVAGWLDDRTMQGPGLYRVAHAIIDTRTLRVTPFELPTDPFPRTPPGILAASPDERSVVWFSEVNEGPVLGVTRIADTATYLVPIDRPRMRFAEPEDLTVEWVEHHFRWRHADHGDSLEARPDLVPLPYRGEFALGKPGDYSAYYLRPGSDRLRLGILQLLTAELGGVAATEESNSTEQTVVFDGKRVGVSFVESGGFVSVSMLGKDADPELIGRIGRSIDRILATGRLDPLFVP